MGFLNKPVKFIKEVKVELSKVAWSTREELIGATLVVIVATFLAAIYIGGIDMVLSKALSLLFQ